MEREKGILNGGATIQVLDDTRHDKYHEEQGMGAARIQAFNQN